jgi:hypothetical protein
MRFRLRTLLVVVLLVYVSAPWWNQWRREISNWLWPTQPPVPLISAEEYQRLLNVEATVFRQGGFVRHAQGLYLDELDRVREEIRNGTLKVAPPHN